MSCCRKWRLWTPICMMTAPKGLDLGLRYRCADPRAGSLRLHDGDGLHRRSGDAGGLKLIFEYLPARLRQRSERSGCPRKDGATPPRMAGMAFANAFLGVCHSMAHKLGAFHHLPHGVANALLIDAGHPLQQPPKFPRRWVPSRSTTYPHTLRSLRRSRRLPRHQGRKRRREAGKPDSQHR